MAGIKRWLHSADVLIDEDSSELLVRVGGSVTAKRVKIDAASDAAAGNTLVAAVVDKRICVLGICLIAADAVEATFYSGPADTGAALSGPLSLAANGGFIVNSPADPAMHCLATEPNQSLTLKLSAAVQCSGWLVYYES